jgi:NAD+ kinase
MLFREAFNEERFLMRVMLFGGEVDEIRDEASRHPGLEMITESPDVIVCYGGDGTLLAAENRWPSIPKVPIKHSLRGNRCIAHAASEVLTRLERGELVRTEYIKLQCVFKPRAASDAPQMLTAMNEFSVHLARINSAVRFSLWVDDEPYNGGREILGDGFVVSTPFGSTAYFNHITRGLFRAGIGIAFKSTSEHTNHMVVGEDVVVRILITRGPAILAYDNSRDYFDIGEGDELTIRKHTLPAVLLTWSAMKYPSDAF